MGSVKDLVILREPVETEEESRAGVGQFIFSDRYSVFDWGKMPDNITDKGKALCIVSAYFFERLEELGIKTHYLGIVEDGKVKKLDELEKPQNIMEFKLLRVIKPKIYKNTYDYSIYKQEKKNFLIPLEIIYRNALSDGSSVFKRLKEGSLKLKNIGLKSIVVGEVLDKPILDISTKLEVKDRYISWEEASKICNLTEKEIEEIKEITLFINRVITEETKKIGLFNEDGKIEFGFDEERNLIVVDAVGTLDECRFTYQGISVSKEIARIYYRNTSWYKDVELAKKQDRLNWKTRIQSVPPRMPKELVSSLSLIYKAYANELTKKRWFSIPSLKDVLNNIKDLIYSYDSTDFKTR